LVQAKWQGQGQGQGSWFQLSIPPPPAHHRRRDRGHTGDLHLRPTVRTVQHDSATLGHSPIVTIGMPEQLGALAR